MSLYLFKLILQAVMKEAPKDTEAGADIINGETVNSLRFAVIADDVDCRLQLRLHLTLVSFSSVRIARTSLSLIIVIIIAETLEQLQELTGKVNDSAERFYPRKT